MSFTPPFTIYVHCNRTMGYKQERTMLSAINMTIVMLKQAFIVIFYKYLCETCPNLRNKNVKTKASAGKIFEKEKNSLH